MITIGTFFSGIGAPEQAVRHLGLPHNIAYACDNDPYVKSTYLHNYRCGMFYDDITTIRNLPTVDLLVFGFPCQPFSLAGKGLGLEDQRGQLVFHALNLIEKSHPRHIIAENVAGLVTRDGGKLLHDIESRFRKMGYNVKSSILDSLGFGLPQKRERVWIVATKDKHFTFPTPSQHYPSLASFLDLGPSENVYATYSFLEKPKVQQRLSEYKKNYINCITHTISRNGSSGEYISYVAAVQHAIGETRKPTVNECRRLFGFGKDFEFPEQICMTRRYNMFGNSMAVPVLSAIISKIDFSKKGS